MTSRDAAKPAIPRRAQYRHNPLGVNLSWEAVRPRLIGTLMGIVVARPFESHEDFAASATRTSRLVAWALQFHPVETTSLIHACYKYVSWRYNQVLQTPPPLSLGPPGPPPPPGDMAAAMSESHPCMTRPMPSAFSLMIGGQLGPACLSRCGRSQQLYILEKNKSPMRPSPAVRQSAVRLMADVQQR